MDRLTSSAALPCRLHGLPTYTAAGEVGGGSHGAQLVVSSWLTARACAALHLPVGWGRYAPSGRRESQFQGQQFRKGVRRLSSCNEDGMARCPFP